jgi:hypothetical protein
LVDASRQRFTAELFEPGREADLLRALVAPDPDVAATAAAIDGTGEPGADDVDQDGDSQDDGSQ